MDSSEVFSVLIYLVVGMITGIVNTLAGGGTIFVFSTLIFLGMPAGMANGTNRLGVLIQNLTGVITFFRSGLLDLKSTAQYILPTVIGSVLGALVVTDLPAGTLNLIVGVVMLGLLYPILNKPKPSMTRKIGNMRPSVRFVIFLILGFYGGFVQVGIGLVILVVLNQLGFFSLIRANAVKMAIIFLLTIPAFLVFAFNGQIDWPIAIWLAIGQFLGTWLVGRLLTNNKLPNDWVKWLLLCMVLGSALRMFGFFEWAWSHLSVFCC